MDANIKEQVRQLEMLLVQKGYRQRFALLAGDSARTVCTGSLAHCLEMLVSEGGSQNYQFLETHAPYRPDIRCRFKMSYTQSDGFGIRELEIREQRTNEQLVFRLRNNQELPGSMSLEGRLPKETLLQKIMKGKSFRR